MAKKNKVIQDLLKEFLRTLIEEKQIHPDDVSHIAYDIRIMGYVNELDGSGIRVGREVGMMGYDNIKGLIRNKPALEARQRAKEKADLEAKEAEAKENQTLSNPQ